MAFEVRFPLIKANLTWWNNYPSPNALINIPHTKQRIMNVCIGICVYPWRQIRGMSRARCRGERPQRYLISISESMRGHLNVSKKDKRLILTLCSNMKELGCLGNQFTAWHFPRKKEDSFLSSFILLSKWPGNVVTKSNAGKKLYIFLIFHQREN